MKLFIYLALLWAALYVHEFALLAQTFQRDNWGANVGLLLAVGTKVNRVGIKINVYAHAAQMVQGNVQWCGIYAFNSYGPKLARPEQQWALGITGNWGKADSLQQPFLSPISNQTRKPYSVGYAYLWYKDGIGTAQKSGMVALQFDQISLVCENDLFAGQGRDRYRTGALGVYYSGIANYRLALLNIMFTPDPKGMPKVRNNAQYPAPFGYIDFSQAPYAQASHGILALQVERALPYGQMAGLQMGVDSEKIRHIMQNKLIHDMPFVPRKLNRARNPHMPMIDQNGKLYLFEQAQKIKSARFWGQIIANTPNFY